LNKTDPTHMVVLYFHFEDLAHLPYNMSFDGKMQLTWFTLEFNHLSFALSST